MTQQTLDPLDKAEEQIEEILNGLEMKEKLPEALLGYQNEESKIIEVKVEPKDPLFSKKQRVLAYCLMREANILRQLGRSEEAAQTSDRELVAARESGDDITLARSLMSQGTSLILAKNIQGGLGLIDEARALFETGTSFDHKQGLGWYWILQADLANAGMAPGGHGQALEAANHAIPILTSIRNWPGVARAYEARAKARDTMGDHEAAEEDRRLQAKYQDKTAETTAPTTPTDAHPK